MMDTGGGEFGVLMQQACALKSAQVKQDRRLWELKPKHIQHTLFHNPEQRGEEFDDVKVRLDVATGFKETAKAAFEDGRYVDAIDQYERALGCVTFYTTREPNWRKEGIKDADLTLHEFEPDDEHVKSFKTSCLANIAACYLKLPAEETDYQECVLVCSCALELKPSFTKALYRRAQARLLPVSSGAMEMELAEKDLKEAYRLDPNNVTIRKELRKLLEQKSKQKLADKTTYSGLFDKKSLDFDKHIEKENRGGENRICYEEKQARQAESQLYMELSKKYEREGQEEKSKELAKASKIAAERATNPTKRNKKKSLSTDSLDIDWENPTEALIKDAKQHGIDLTDPLIRAEMLRMSREREGDEKGENFAADGQDKAEQGRSLSPVSCDEVQYSLWPYAMAMVFISFLYQILY